MSTPSVSSVEIPGPWRHEYVAANGARFHVATTGPLRGRPVLLLHGFPHFWWAWRHQLTGLAEAGHRVVAMDLRGYGGSDKTPRGYDPMTLAADVAGVVKSMGLGPTALVGHGWGGYIAWAVATLHPDQVSRVATVSAPHPLATLRAVWHGGPLVTHVLAMQPPWVPERKIRGEAYLRGHLSAWSGSGTYPSDAEVSTYARALANWPSPHCAVEYHRWLFRSRLREDGRRFRAAMRPRCTVPSYVVFGGSDPALPASYRNASGAYCAAEHRVDVVEGAGHFVPEEAPAHLTRLLVDFLR